MKGSFGEQQEGGFVVQRGLDNRGLDNRVCNCWWAAAKTWKAGRKKEESKDERFFLGGDRKKKLMIGVFCSVILFSLGFFCLFVFLSCVRFVPGV